MRKMSIHDMFSKFVSIKHTDFVDNNVVLDIVFDGERFTVEIAHNGIDKED